MFNGNIYIQIIMLSRFSEIVRKISMILGFPAVFGATLRHL